MVSQKKLAPAAETAPGRRIFLWKSATRGALAERALSVLPPPVAAANPPGACDVRSLLRGKKK